MAHDIFISYKRKDEMLALCLVMPLIAAGYDVWWDKSFYQKRETVSFPKEIEKQARGCKDFILLVTENTFVGIEKKENWIRKELLFALEGESGNRPRITPIVINDNSIPKVLPNDINIVLDEENFTRFPRDEIMEAYGQGATFSRDKLQELFQNKLCLQSSPSFERTKKSKRGILYADNYASSKEEHERLIIQSENTKKFDMRFINEIVEAHPDGGLSVLDLGCNNGDLTRSRFDSDRFQFVVGVDCSEQCIRNARESVKHDKNAKRKYSFIKLSIDDSDFNKKLRSEVVELSADHTEEEEVLFDVIFAAQVLHFVDNNKYDACLTNLRDLLKPGGVLIVRESDDGTKMCYGCDNCEETLKKIIDMTDSLNKVADRHMGRKLYRLLDNCNYCDVRLFSFQRDTSNLSEKAKMDLYKETFPWRLTAVADENAKTSETYRIMEDSLREMEVYFKKRDFWYSEYEFICIGTKREQED